VKLVINKEIYGNLIKKLEKDEKEGNNGTPRLGVNSVKIEEKFQNKEKKCCL
jgi:hypothetical protein